LIVDDLAGIAITMGAAAAPELVADKVETGEESLLLQHGPCKVAVVDEEGAKEDEGYARFKFESDDVEGDFVKGPDAVSPIKKSLP
jgi:hypothetical protein